MQKALDKALHKTLRQALAPTRRGVARGNNDTDRLRQEDLTKQGVSGSCETENANEADGIRTRNHRIDSPVL